MMFVKHYAAITQDQRKKITRDQKNDGFAIQGQIASVISNNIIEEGGDDAPS